MKLTEDQLDHLAYVAHLELRTRKFVHGQILTDGTGVVSPYGLLHARHQSGYEVRAILAELHGPAFNVSPLWTVVVDLANKSATVVTPTGRFHRTRSGVTRSTVSGWLATIGFMLDPDEEWTLWPILGALDGFKHVLIPIGTHGE